MDRKQREEALNEVTVLRALQHPYIISYRESFMDKKYFFTENLTLFRRYLCIVMDYADGGDLYLKIVEQRKLGKPFA
jgi:NIMA (never in mitosis gene a)-related kinase